jgi:hypothetical protein
MAAKLTLSLKSAGGQPGTPTAKRSSSTRFVVSCNRLISQALASQRRLPQRWHFHRPSPIKFLPQSGQRFFIPVRFDHGFADFFILGWRPLGV